MMNSKEIRQKFLDFFESKKHTIVPSAPMVIKNDPTLMFTNAGMNQFKDYFLGNTKPKEKRIADTQKCLRVSGKHNDLEEVGHDSYHHTMFEMLGNWSFGDYFKEQAIDWAWELLTQVYGIDKNLLYVTVFEGDPKENLHRDEESHQFWEKHLPSERIINGNKKDNFWEMGEQGPCGPCTEIHIDLRSEEEKKKIPGKDLVNKDHPEVIEIWNLVFMQFNRRADGSLEPLSANHVDTGMGFERLCRVLQGKKSNYDTDIFTPLIDKIEELTHIRYGADPMQDVAFRVIADHIRAVAFSIADGQLPSNTGAGYVIRRILRRAVRYGFTYLKQKEPFIYELTYVLAFQMKEVFPELYSQSVGIATVIQEEERSFLRTLEQGLLLLDAMMANNPEKFISGSKAFELYDTYGFPIDLTALILSEKGFSLDYEGFEKELEKQKNRSRKAAEVKAGDWVVLRDDQEEEFVGYDTLQALVKITRYRKVQSQKDGVLYQLVFNMTPFYPEGGGQVGDKGYIQGENGDVSYIIDTKKENNLIIHLSETLPTNLEDTFQAIVDPKAREAITANHSATHLLHQALRKVLGTHVEQKGSRVDLDYLRFDFSHFGKISKEQLLQIEFFVNERIAERIPLEEFRSIPIEQALNAGAMALFGEKYGDHVRMIQFGESRELCGGTHVSNTAEIRVFKIISEGAVASGIRRIEAKTNWAALLHYQQQEDTLNEIKEALKSGQNPLKAVQHLQAENTRLAKEVEQLKKEQSKLVANDLQAQMQERNGVSFLAKKLPLDAQTLKNLAFGLGQNKNNAFIVLGAETEPQKAVLLCYISKELAQEKGLDAGKIIRELGKYINGSGGGQPFFATAGGKNPQGIDTALSKAQDFLP